MNFTIVEAEQRSDLWRQARAGRLTGSRAKDMLATIKTGEAAARRDYRLQLVTERLIGSPQDDVYVNAEMQRGIDCEPLALAAYEIYSGNVVRQTGFLTHNTCMAGCSLDGDVDNFRGVTEFKCPKSATHLRYLRAGVFPSEHLPQARHNLWVSGAEWIDFGSWDDRFPEHLQFFCVRAYAKDLDIPGYERDAMRFLAEVNVEYNELLTLKVAA